MTALNPWARLAADIAALTRIDAAWGIPNPTDWHPPTSPNQNTSHKEDQ